MSSPAPARVLFVTSNGTGLGHLTRSLAIARRLGLSTEALFVTFSAAAPVVRGLGFPVEYVASYDRPGAGDDLRWTRRARARLEAIVAEAQPAAVLFDGTHPYERLLPALRSGGAALAWCRRAMWRPEADSSALWRSHLFDAVLEPGEVAADADRGPTVSRRAEAHRVGPVVLLDRRELLPRPEAERELGLEPGRPAALVQLGQGPGVREANERCLRHLAGREVQVAALASTLEDLADVPEGVIRLPATYPISRYLAAFDLAVAAAGYNAFHELIAAGVPALYVPMSRQTDDQAARARHAEEHGLGLAVAGPYDTVLERRLDGLLDSGRRAAIRERLASLPEPRGAAEAAEWLEALASEGAGGDGRPGAASPRSRSDGPEVAGDAAPGTPASVRLRRAWIFASSVPRTVLRLGRQILTRPRTRTIVLALGVGEELGDELAKLLADTGERPERVLVVTDGLDFKPLLAAGVGFEHVPGPGERQPELAGDGYEDFRLGRVELILSGRPRPRRVLALGEVPERVFAAACSPGGGRGTG